MPIRKMPDRDIIYTFSEVYGPFECEAYVNNRLCNKESWAVLLSKYELDKVMKIDEIGRPKYILNYGIGKMVCADHGGV